MTPHPALRHLQSPSVVAALGGLNVIRAGHRAPHLLVYSGIMPLGLGPKGAPHLSPCATQGFVLFRECGTPPSLAGPWVGWHMLSSALAHQHCICRMWRLVFTAVVRSCHAGGGHHLLAGCESSYFTSFGGRVYSELTLLGACSDFGWISGWGDCASDWPAGFLWCFMWMCPP